MMENIVSLPTLYKRDTKGKVREWTVQYSLDEVAGVRAISGLCDGQKVTSEWNISVAKNIGRANATTSRSQAKSEAESLWAIKAEKEYFEDLTMIDSYEKFKPMLAHDYTKRPQDSGYSQPKLDGIRCVADANGLWTRSGKAITSCPHIWEAIEPFIKAHPGIVVDGELYNHELKADFNKITSLVRKAKSTPADIEESASLVQYHVYDCYIKDAVFTERNALLKALGAVASGYIQYVDTQYCKDQDALDKLYSEYMQAGYEGQMVRNDTPYECKRSKNLLKRKEFITEEFEVIQVLEGQGNWAGYAKRFILRDKDGKEFGSGVRGQQAQLKELWEMRDTAKGMPNWATCRFFELTPDGVPRFPVIIDYGHGLRED